MTEYPPTNRMMRRENTGRSWGLSSTCALRFGVGSGSQPHIVIEHLRFAVHELPMTAEQAARFGPYAPVILDLLAEDQSVRKIDDRWYWTLSEYPAAKVNLRNIAGPVYTIQDESQAERVIGTLDEISALSAAHARRLPARRGNVLRQAARPRAEDRPRGKPRSRQILQAVRDVIDQCACDDGFPSSVGAAMPAFTSSDLDSSIRGRIPSKKAARRQLQEMLGPPVAGE